MRTTLESYLIRVFQQRIHQQYFADDNERSERLRAVQNRIVNLLDSWQTVVDAYLQAPIAVQYQQYEGTSTAKPLLRDTLDTHFESEHHRSFRASRSLRDVEPDVNLYLRDANNQPVEE